jgi:hypothetical protein
MVKYKIEIILVTYLIDFLWGPSDFIHVNDLAESLEVYNYHKLTRLFPVILASKSRFPPLLVTFLVISKNWGIYHFINACIYSFTECYLNVVYHHPDIGYLMKIKSSL